MHDNKFSFSEWLKENSMSLGVFSTSKRVVSVEKKENIRIERSHLIPTYSQFEEINKLFNAYVPKCSDPNVFVHQLYKLELTGAKVYINNKPCIIVEERKNSILTISKDNRLRTHIKAGLRFIFELNNVKYCVLGKYLKLNRFLKK